MDILNKKYAIDVLVAIGDKQRSFNDIKEELGTYSSTLSRRLKELEKDNLIRTKFLKEGDRNRIKYELTENGLRILPKAREIVRLSGEMEASLV